MLATGTPVRRGIQLDWNARKLELLIHRQLAEKRLHGEWFDVALADVVKLYEKGFVTPGHVEWRTAGVTTSLMESRT